MSQPRRSSVPELLIGMGIGLCIVFIILVLVFG